MKIEQKRLKQMYQYKNYNKEIIKLVCTIVVGFIVDLAFPILAKQLLDVQIPDKNIKGVILFGMIYMIIGGISCYITLKYCIIRLNLRYYIRGELKEDIFNRLQEVSTKFYDKNTTGMILQFLSNDAEDASILFPRVIVEMFIMGIARMMVISIVLLFMNIEIGLGIIAIYTIGIMIYILSNRKTMSLLNEIRKTNIEVFNLMNEGIGGFATIKECSLQKEKIERLEEVIEEYNKAARKLNSRVSRYQLTFQFIISFATVWSITKGIIGMHSGIITYGLIIIIMDWTSYLKSCSKWILRHISNFNKSYLAFCKILNFLEIDEVEDLEQGENISKIKKIEFKSIIFGYNEEETVIRKFNLVADKGKHIALVGKTGSGKSTIANMLCGFYTPNKGEILVNDKPMKEFKLRDIRSRIRLCYARCYHFKIYNYG